MNAPARPRRILVCHAAPEAFAPMSRTILAKLGFHIVAPEDYPALAEAMDRDRPDLRIVDERRLAELPYESPTVPVVVLSGRHGVTGADSRIVGAVRRPAGMHELYRLVQEVLEETPRATPRIPTHLAARCRRQGREWRAAVLSLSENGCLLRSPEPLMLGSNLEISFELPVSGALQCDAEIAYQLLPDLGLVFHASTPAVREAIQAYVARALATS
jgi:hypothetical protein